jgi:hypothetical protein
MESVQIWILSGLAAFLVSAGWWSIRNWITKIDKKFDRLIKAVEDQGKTQAVQSVQLQNINKRVDEQHGRLNDHGERIRKIESKIEK